MLAVLLSASDHPIEPPAPSWPGSIALVAGSGALSTAAMAALAIGGASCPRLPPGSTCVRDFGVPIGIAIAGALVLALGVGWLVWVTRD